MRQFHARASPSPSSYDVNRKRSSRSVRSGRRPMRRRPAPSCVRRLPTAEYSRGYLSPNSRTALDSAKQRSRLSRAATIATRGQSAATLPRRTVIATAPRCTYWARSRGPDGFAAPRITPIGPILPRYGKVSSYCDFDVTRPVFRIANCLRTRCTVRPKQARGSVRQHRAARRPRCSPLRCNCAACAAEVAAAGAESRRRQAPVLPTKGGWGMKRGRAARARQAAERWRSPWRWRW